MHRDQLPIAEPCHADWNAMRGGDGKRFCGACTKHVHDLSSMTARRAERVLATEPSPCVRYAVGADGQILHATGARWPRWVAIGVALLGAVPAFASGMAAEPAPPEPGLMERVLRRAQEAVGLVPEAVVSQGQVVVMGEPAIEPPPPPPPPVVMGRIARPPTIVRPPPVPPPVRPPPPPPEVRPDFGNIPMPGPGETVIPEVAEALAQQ